MKLQKYKDNVRPPATASASTAGPVLATAPSPLLPLLPPPSPSQFSLQCVPGSIILTLNTLYLQTVRSAEIFG